MKFRKSATIKIFLEDGTAEGLRIVEKSLWTGKGLVFPRNLYSSVQVREEFNGPGVYVLTGPDPTTPGGAIVYIGQTEVVRDRLSQHFKNKDFWTSAVLFVNKDANLNNAHFRFLESRLVQLALKTKRAKVENGNQPVAPKLSESEVADAESFLDDMLVIYPLVGVDAFEDSEMSITEMGNSNLRATLRLELIGRGVSAYGQLISSGLLVESGSQVRHETQPSFEGSYVALRNSLI